MILKTPLWNYHKKLNAHFINFAGFEMPLYYENIINEYNYVRNNFGVFDLSHMGEIEIYGKDALKFSNYLITNDLTPLPFGKALYSPMCNEKGGIVDDVVVYKISNERILFVVNAANIQKDYEWMNKNKIDDVYIKNISNQIVLISVQGPKAEEFLIQILGEKIKNLNYYEFFLENNYELLISRTGYTGEDGFEIFCNDITGQKLWQRFMDLNTKFCGLGSRDILRLEAGYLLYGNDMNEEIDPITCGISWTIKFGKEDFIGKNELMKLKTNKKLVSFTTDEKIIPRHNNEVFYNDTKIGFITSGVFSPYLNKPFGFAIIDISFLDKDLFVKVRDRFVKIQICDRVLYHPKVKRKKII